MSSGLSGEAGRELASDVAEVVGDLADDLGGPPLFQEFLDVLGWSFPPTEEPM